MNANLITVGTSIVVLSFTLVMSLEASTPNVINYQGHIQSGSAAFSGPGQFKFAILRSGTTWWRNATDGNGDGEPDAAVTRTITNGLFTVPLGDTSMANMAAMTFFDPGDPNNSSSSSAPVLLRIWFSDGSPGFQQLAPDQPLDRRPVTKSAAVTVRPRLRATNDQWL